MSPTFDALKILHIIAISSWFGHKLLVPADIRRSLQGDPQAARDLVGRVERAARIGIGSGLVTIASGVALVLTLGGFGVMPVRIHMALALVIVMFVLGGTLARPSWSRARKAIAGGDLDGARAAADRLIIVIVVEQALWLIVLVLMVVRF